MTELERLLADTLAEPGRALPVPPGVVARVTEQTRRTRRRRTLVTAGGALSVAAIAVVVALVSQSGGRQTLSPSSPTTSQTGTVALAVPQPRPGVVVGVTRTADGRPVATIAVLPGSLGRLLTRTAADGSFTAPCLPGLLLASYAPSRYAAPSWSPEVSPGVGNWAWQRVDTQSACGSTVTITLLPGGVVEGRAGAVDRVHLVRVSANGTVAPDSPVFAGRVGADGTYRVEGLDTGRYLVTETPSVRVDVVQGRITTSP